MENFKFSPGERVRVTQGAHAGRLGQVIRWNLAVQRFQVRLDGDPDLKDRRFLPDKLELSSVEARQPQTQTQPQPCQQQRGLEPQDEWGNKRAMSPLATAAKQQQPPPQKRTNSGDEGPASARQQRDSKRSSSNDRSSLPHLLCQIQWIETLWKMPPFLSYLFT